MMHKQGSAKRRYQIVFSLLMALALGVSMPCAASAGTVAATVDGEKIMREDVMSAIKNLPVQGVDGDKVYPIVLDQIINEKLIDKAARAAKIEGSADFKKRLDILHAQLLKQMYLENAVEDKISDRAVRAEYDRFRRENSGKTEVRARHILLATEAEAEKVIKDLDGGADFEKLAKERSSGPSAQAGGDLGYFIREEMVEEFSKAAFDLKKGAYTKKPVRTKFGWHVIKVEDRRDRRVPKFEEVQGAIRNKLGQDALQELIDGLRAKAKVVRFDAKGNPVQD